MNILEKRWLWGLFVLLWTIQWNMNINYGAFYFNYLLFLKLDPQIWQAAIGSVDQFKTSFTFKRVKSYRVHMVHATKQFTSLQQEVPGQIIHHTAIVLSGAVLKHFNDCAWQYYWIILLLALINPIISVDLHAGKVLSCFLWPIACQSRCKRVLLIEVFTISVNYFNDRSSRVLVITELVVSRTV